MIFTTGKSYLYLLPILSLWLVFQPWWYRRCGSETASTSESERQSWAAGQLVGPQPQKQRCSCTVGVRGKEDDRGRNRKGGGGGGEWKRERGRGERGEERKGERLNSTDQHICYFQPILSAHNGNHFTPAHARAIIVPYNYYIGHCSILIIGTVITSSWSSLHKALTHTRLKWLIYVPACGHPKCILWQVYTRTQFLASSIIIHAGAILCLDLCTRKVLLSGYTFNPNSAKGRATKVPSFES